MFYVGDFVKSAWTRNAWLVPVIGRVIAVNGDKVTVEYAGEILTTIKTVRATQLALAY